MVRYGFLLGAAAILLGGCASFKACHRSPLVELHAPGGEERSELAGHASWFEDAIVQMADDFQVPLEDVIPVQVYHQGEKAEGRSYYNRLTRAIVLRGPLDRSVFVHELSHLLAHRVHRSPPYWSDQALAEYMESRFAGAGPAAIRLVSFGDGPGSPRERLIVARMAQARDAGEVLEHLAREAVDEERGWGVVVVRYLFEERWTRTPMPEKIRRLLALRESEVREIVPGLLRWCRRPGFLAAAGASPAR